MLLLSSARGTTWSIDTVDSTGTVGYWPSIALDSSGNPHISYFDSTNGDLKYARWTGYSWYIRTVDSTGDLGYSPSIALDSSGNPHISYFDYTNSALKYARWTGLVWLTETVDSIGSVGIQPSLALDSSGNPHISYRDNTNNALKYAKWTTSGWSIQIVDSPGVGWESSLALDSSGNPHISYRDGTNYALKYAKWTTSGWSIQTAVSPGVTGSSSLALDSSGNPHISYFDSSSNSLKYAKHSYTWSIQTVDTASVSGYSSLALDSSGNPRISYNGPTDGDLKYARWTGSNWSIQTVDSGDSTYFAYSSLALDSDGNPHISYYDLENGDLKYAKPVPNSPPAVSVISGPTSGYRGDAITVTATATDPDGDPLTYEWLIDSTPFPESTGSSFNFTIGNNQANVGDHVIKVRAKDAIGEYSAWKTMDFETLNHAPTVSVVTGPTSGYKDQAYTWTTTGFDVEGDPLTYEWYVDGTYKSGGSDFTYTFGSDDAMSSHTINVRVKDTLEDYSDNSTLTFTLIESEMVATPTFSPSGGTYSSAQSVSISCGTSGATIRYTTDGSEPTASSATYSSAISVSSTTTIKAKAFKSGMTDSDTGSTTYTITTEPFNVLPVASFTLSPSTQETNNPVAFNAAGSSDSDGSIASYAWDFGDGNTGSGVTASNSYSTAGTYTVKLTVTDDEGAKATTTKTITITSTPPPPKGSLNINNDAASTDSATVTLNLAAELSSNIAEMRFSNDNVEWSDWTTYAAWAPWTLQPGDGTKTVYVQFKDDNGQISTFSDTITLNIPAEGIPLWILLAVIIIIIVISAVIAFLLLRKPKKPVPTQLRITAEPANIVADGQTKSIITLQLLDKNGKPIPAMADTQVQISATNGKLEKPTVVVPKGKDAEKTAIVSSREPGEVPVKAKAEGLKSVTITLNFTEKTRYCMHCGAIMPPRAKACEKCGKAPPAGVDTKVCHNCKSVIPVVAKFCSECGTGQKQ
jgi:PKD repeat protein/ribosomal protein L40E